MISRKKICEIGFFLSVSMTGLTLVLLVAGLATHLIVGGLSGMLEYFYQWGSATYTLRQLEYTFLLAVVLTVLKYMFFKKSRNDDAKKIG